MLCRVCGKELIKIGDNSDWIAYGCNDYHCRLFAHPQHYEPKNPGGVMAPRWRLAPWTYEDEKAKQRENYQLLVNAGVSPQQAARMRSDRQTRMFLEQNE